MPKSSSSPVGADSPPTLLLACERWLSREKGNGLIDDQPADPTSNRAAAWSLLQLVAWRLLEAAAGIDGTRAPLVQRLRDSGPSAQLWREVRLQLGDRSLAPLGALDVSTEPAWLASAEQLLAPYHFSPRERGEGSDALPALVTPCALSQLYEQFVAETSGSRRLRGTYFTPVPVVEFICRQALGGWLAAPAPSHGPLFAPPTTAAADRERIGELRRLFSPQQRAEWFARLGELSLCDPAAGAGAFLITAGQVWRRGMRRLSQSLLRTRHAPEERTIDRSPRLTGIDLQPAAVAVCRLRLALARQDPGERSVPLPGERPPIDVPQLLRDWHAAARDVVIGDALLEPALWPKPADVVIGNPPYLAARQLLQQFGREYKERLAGLYEGARGSYDLFALFCEASLRHASPGGVVSLLAPNKFMAADYARPVRRQWAAQQLLQLTNLADLQLFADASVYPIVLTARKLPPTPAQQTSLVERPASLASLPLAPVRQCLQSACCPPAGEPWSWGTPPEKSHGQLLPLGQLARVEAGVAGFSAHRLLAGVVDSAVDPSSADGRQTLPLVVTGNIDPYVVRHGGVRYLKRQFDRPWLWAEEEYASAGKLALFRQPKIVIGGLGRRLEAAYAAEPLAVGVQVMCVTRWQCDPLYLLAALNSNLVTDWYRQRFGARHLNGGYLGFHRGQLAQTPIPRVSPRRQQAVARHVRQLLQALNENDLPAVARRRQVIETAIGRDYRGLLLTAQS